MTIPDEETIFNEARRIGDPAARSAYLAQTCGDDTSLRQRIESLLTLHENQGSFLGSPAIARPETVPDLDPPLMFTAPGAVIGRYKLLEPIGEGGYGTVFMAEQTSPVHRKVALKIIKAGMDTRQVIARFEAERQALALMDHPNIAKVFDAGVTDTGRPYFVMELVKGIPITKYCDEHKLTPKKRLELFIQVCHAVQHAHQKGIIHRDLKPSNVLIAQYDGVPVPKVIDFGVAKATGQQLTERTMFTGFGDVIGTPQYMSPEQAELNQLDIDTRSDIYSLGVLLYELLTGTTPLESKRVKEAALLEVLRVIREEEPPRPSTRLTTVAELPSIAAQRGLEPKSLSGIVKGELDWIVMKALEKDRSRRYETANGLARDIERYMSDEPVSACPPSATYRLRKVFHRYRVPLAVAAGFLLLLLAGTVVSTYQAIMIRAEQQNTVAQKLEADRQRRRAEQERDRAVAAEQKALTEARKSEQVAAFMTDMLKGVGPWVALGRDTTMLREILDNTAKRLDQLKGQPAVEADLRTVLGSVYMDLGDNQSAEAMFRIALARRRELLGEKHLSVAKSITDVGEALSQQKQWVEAERLLLEGLAMQRELLGNDHPAVGRTIFRLGLLYNRQGKGVEAEPHFREALAISRRHPEAKLDGPLGQLGLSLAYQARYSEAEPIMRENLARARKHAPSGSPGVAYGLHNLGWLLRDAGRLEEAEPLLREALELRLKQLGPSHPDTVVTQIIFAESLRRQRKIDEAEALAKQALATTEHQYGRRHAKAVSPLYVLGRIGHDQGRLAEGEAYLREALSLAEENFPDDWSTHSSRRALGCVLVAQKRYNEAEPLLLSSFRAMKQWEGGIPSWARPPFKEAAQALEQLYDVTGQQEKLAQWKNEWKELQRLYDAPTTRRAHGVMQPSSQETQSAGTPGTHPILPGRGRAAGRE